MNATIIPRYEAAPRRNRGTAIRVNASTVQTDSEAASRLDVRVHSGSTLQGTNLDLPTDVSEVEAEVTSAPPIQRAYPHLMDGPAGEACQHVTRALEHARRALEMFGETDLDDINTQFSIIAVTMAKAHQLTQFNDSFGAVLSFIRRATLTASSAEVSRPALNGLVQALHSLLENPLIDLGDAAELVESLSELGWQGEHKAVDRLVAALFNEIAEESGSEQQTDLFAL